MPDKLTLPVTIYILLYIATDADKCYFQDPEILGCYLSLQDAQKSLENLSAQIKDEMDERYDQEERDETCWLMYQEGYAAACYSRLEILTSELDIKEIEEVTGIKKSILYRNLPKEMEIG